MYKHTNVLNIAPLTSDFIFVHNYIILCDDWFLIISWFINYTVYHDKFITKLHLDISYIYNKDKKGYTSIIR